jgi:hypothetical protein
MSRCVARGHAARGCRSLMGANRASASASDPVIDPFQSGLEAHRGAEGNRDLVGCDDKGLEHGEWVGCAGCSLRGRETDRPSGGAGRHGYGEGIRGGGGDRGVRASRSADNAVLRVCDGRPPDRDVVAHRHHLRGEYNGHRQGAGRHARAATPRFTRTASAAPWIPPGSPRAGCCRGSPW